MKKLILLCHIAILFISIIFTVSAYSDDNYINGDVDYSGNLTIRDATKIQKNISKAEIFSDSMLKLADFNLDGDVNILDVTEIQKVISKITNPPVEYVTPEKFGMTPDVNDDLRLFQKVLDYAEKRNLTVDLQGKTYHIYNSEAKVPIINGTLKMMPESSLVLIGDNVSLKNLKITRWWKGDCYWNGDVRLHLTNGCVIEDCDFTSYESNPSIFCNTSANNTIIRNCTFCEGFGILFDDGNSKNREYNGVTYNDTIGSGLFVDNCKFNTNEKAVEFTGDNIEVNTPNYRFSDVKVTNCISYGTKADAGSTVGIGFGFAQVDKLVCSNNQLYNIDGSGAIHMESCTSVESKNNLIKNSHYGIMCIYSNDAIYDSNSIEGCEFGIHCLAYHPYGYDENIKFINNNIVNCSRHPFFGSGLRNSEISKNIFVSDYNYFDSIIKLEYCSDYATSNVAITENTIYYSGGCTDKNWAYIFGTDCTVSNNKIFGLDPEHYINSNQHYVKIQLELPPDTPITDKLYLASNINGWNVADSNYVFTRTSETSAELLLNVPMEFLLNTEYKITRGSWSKCECNEDGSGNVGDLGAQNHMLNALDTGYYKINISAWTDMLL